MLCIFLHMTSFLSTQMYQKHSQAHAVPEMNTLIVMSGDCYC